MSRNNVRGPTSALTEFLRESGITTALVTRRVRQGQGARADPQQPAAGPSNADGENAEDGSAQDAANEEYNSDKLDESEDENPSAKKKCKLSKKAAEKAKAKEKAKLKKKKGGKDDDSDYEDDEDEYTALSKSMYAKTSPAKPPVGSFENCAKCEKKFTVTRYTVAANPPPGFLCHDCAKATGTDPFKKPALPRKRKNPQDKRKVVNFDDKELPSLASMCIKIISNHINDVEALGNIGQVNLDEISRVLARNRSMTCENAPLLYDIQNTKLTLYDATKLTPPAFCTLASLNPGVESLRLDYCGRINDSALSHWSGHLTSLNRLELLGPFLIRIEGWKTFFQSHPQLTGFLITQSPRFDLSCVESLVENCPNLTELRLAQIGKMSDEFLPHIASLQHLEYLDLSEPSSSLSSEAVTRLLEAVGSKLTHLNLSSNDLLDDTVLTEGLLPHAKKLSTLILKNTPELTDSGVASFFKGFRSNPPLHHICMERNHNLGDKALKALLHHSGKELRELNINSWKETGNEPLTTIGNLAPQLRTLDVGWCRQVDDFVVKAVLEGCQNITNISVYGCNKLTINCPRKHGVKIRGIETNAI